MGMPIDELELSSFSNREPWMQQSTDFYHSFLTVFFHVSFCMLNHKGTAHAVWQWHVYAMCAGGGIYFVAGDEPCEAWRIPSKVEWLQ